MAQPTNGVIMRFLLRIAILGLAAFGAKTIYEMLAPKKEQFRSTADDFLDRTTNAAREVGTKVTEATKNVAATAQSSAADVRDTAMAQADEVKAAAHDAVDETTGDANGTSASAKV
jgi:hypothetical protein